MNIETKKRIANASFNFLVFVAYYFLVNLFWKPVTAMNWIVYVVGAVLFCILIKGILMMIMKNRDSS